MPNLDNALRIYKNIGVLLKQGSFVGSAAEAVLEAQQFMTVIIAEMEKNIEQAKTAAEVDAGARSGTDSSGVASGADAGAGRPRGRKKRK